VSEIIGIRPYRSGDLPLLERLLGDPAMTVHLGGPESAEAIRTRHERYLATEGPGELFTIVTGPRGDGVGWVGYWETAWVGEAAWECGWHVVPESQGRGVAHAAALLMLERARSADVHRFMLAFPAVDNAASNAVCRGLGFELLGPVDVEYPKGHMMHSNHWRLDLRQTVRGR